MENSQNVPVDFQAMINAAVAASVEKALSKARASAPDVPKTRRRPRHESESDLSDYQTGDESRPTKRHDKGEEYTPKPPKGKTPAKRKPAKLHTPAPRQEYSSEEEQDPTHSMSVLDEWQADASESDYDAWGSDEKSVSAFMQETLLGAVQARGIEDTADAEPPLDSDTIMDPSGQAMFDPRNIRHPRSGEWSPPEHLSRFMHLWLRKPLEKEVRNRLRSECPRPSLPDKVAQTPEFDKVMTTFMMRSGRDPRRGLEKGLWGAQDNLLDSVGPLARIMYLADDAYAKADSFSTEDFREWAHDIREWAQRCFCFIGNANVTLSSERRKAALFRINGKLADLGTKEIGPQAQGKLFGEPFLKELNKHVNVFTSLNKAQSSMRSVFRSNPTRGVFGRAGRQRGRAASRFWPSGPRTQPTPFYPTRDCQQRPFSRGSDRGRGIRGRGRSRFTAA
ncbi:uncharacterized protein LOC122928313 [Bufo gargarizans]|uniref:uncharacterized protein LOC122928313 n=1 Tax=Bufo gargarizans TaxID=30331 RepID=UPI001CF592A1|nr:uncharacterized protein LOC122928313 [Bufo gargarizans]